MTPNGRMIAVDIGTSSARAVLFDDRANALGHARRTYTMALPQPGWSEQDADMVADAAIDALREAVSLLADGDALAGVVLSAQMYSVLAVDAGGAPLSPSLTWADMRSAGHAAALARAASAGLSQRTGCPVQAIYPLAKIAWLKTHMTLPDGARFISIKDYVIFRLTGQLVTDWSTASATGLLDVAAHAWDGEALALAGISAGALPDLVSPRQILRAWRPEIAQAVGLPADTPLIVGGGDAPFANIGVGAIGPGTIAVNLGTSAAARMLTPAPQTDAAGRLWTYVADVDHWVTGGIIGSGGAVYEWLLKDLLGTRGDDNDLYQEADRLASSVAPGADDLLFIPYFSGEQSPGWSPGARGLVYGLTLRHQPRHTIRAAIEGIVFALLRVVRAIEDLRGEAIARVYVTGGLNRSPVWLSTIANVFGASVVVPRSPESSARGAAIVGWLALDATRDYAAFAQPEDLLQPDMAIHAIYRERYDAFCTLNQHMQALLNR
ncbi:MAG: gluconokinase [Anaerolineae bacterium]|nr:gluconokinase [Anaerolineae bacterium]